MVSNPRLIALNYLRRSHAKRWAKFVAAGCEKYLRASYNEGHWDMQRNGEMHLIRQFALHSQCSPTVLDVGAHEGDWTSQFLAICPKAEIACFEILDPIRKRLIERFKEEKRVHIAQCGLSDSSRTVNVTWNKEYDSTNAINPALDGKYYAGSDLEYVPCDVKTGDSYIESVGIRQIDFLKIDTEGHEVSVLQGFSRLLGCEQSPRVIQFEYGYTWLAERRRLSDLYELLQPSRYVIGRLYPSGAQFKEYSLSEENYRMGNFVAVKSDDPLFRALRYA